MKKAYFVLLLVIGAITLASCDAYNSAMNTHNRIIEKHNNAVDKWNNILQGGQNN